MTQFYSRNDTAYSGDVYSIPFPYSKKDEIKVYIDDELYTAWQFLNDSQIKLTTLPESATTVSVRRVTDISEPVVEYTNNTMLSKEALNLSQNQVLHSVQEIYDNNIVIHQSMETSLENSFNDLKDTIEDNIDAVLSAAETIQELEEDVQNTTQLAGEVSELAGTLEDLAESLTESQESLTNSAAELEELVETLKGMSFRNLFELVASTAPLTHPSLHLADGSVLSGGAYSRLLSAAATVYENNPDIFCTESQWQQSVSTYGVCGKYVYNSTNNSLRIPLVKGVLEGTTTASELGNIVPAGLPTMTTSETGNHTHSGGTLNYTSTGSLNSLIMNEDGNFSRTGNITVTNNTIDTSGTYGFEGDGQCRKATLITNTSGGTWSGATSETGNHTHTVSFGANTNTVQMQTTKVFYYVVVATSTEMESELTTDDLAAINTLADNISNVNAVANALTTINAVAADLTNINAASTNAQLAKDWATKTNGKVDSTDYSAKYYANLAQGASSTVSSAITTLTPVLNDLTNLDSVATNILNINTVGNNISSVNSVASDLTNLNSVASDLTNIDSVASNLSNINSVSTAAQNAASLAQDWATKMTGAVDGSEYSAKYYAQQASQGQIQANWNEVDTTSKSYIQNKPTLATVATSGSYNDLSNKPTIPAAQVNSDWNAVSGAAQILNKPTIPTVNNATLTIQKNGTDVQTFTANASSNVTCNITVPTNTNELTNGAGFITGINSTDVTTALGYSPADVDLSNISSTGQALFDGKADADFSNVDNTAKILMSDMGMPSGVYKNLTLPAHDTTVTAPADGWFYFEKTATIAQQFIRLSANNISTVSISVGSNNDLKVFLPVKSGASCLIGYNAGGTTKNFCFVYAEGSKSLNT